MTVKVPLKLYVLATAALIAAPAAAHHSISAIFEADRLLTVTGTLTRVDWINPHIVIFIDATSGGAVESWKVAAAPPAWWRNVGVSRADFAKGVSGKVSVEVNPAQDGSRYGYLRKIRFASGETLEVTSTQ